jgi:hypothetical protein
MKRILKISFDDNIKWINNEQKIKKILEDPFSPELLILYMNELKETDLTFLTDLQGEKVSIGNSILLIPEEN